MIDGQVFEVLNSNEDYTSSAKGWRNAQQHQSHQRTIQIVITGSFNVDVKLQVSNNNEDWITLPKSVLTDLSDIKENISYEMDCGNHRYWRAVITRNSGTFSAKGYVN